MSELRKPPRPDLPVTFTALACVLAAEAVFFAAVPMDAPARSSFACATFALVAAMIAVTMKIGRLPASVPLLAICLSAGFFVSYLSYCRGVEFKRGAQRTPVSTWELEILTDATESNYGWRCRAKASIEGLPTRDVWVTSSESFEYGTVVQAVGRYTPNEDNEWGRTSLRQGVWGTVKVLSVRSTHRVTGLRGIAVTLRETALKTFHQASSDGRSLLTGCVCGYRRDMDASDLSDLFSTCGVSHLVAVSGGHIAIIASLVAIVSLRMLMRPAARVALTLGLSGLFVLCCGMPVSAMRSWLMSSVAASSQLVGRRSSALSSVCLVSLALALLDPGVTGQLGFQLSIASVIALCIATPYVSYLLDALFPRFPIPRPTGSSVRARIGHVSSDLRSELASTLVAQTATIPLTAPIFSELSLVAPLANVVLAYPFTILVSLGSIAAILPFAPHVQAALIVVCEAVGAFVVMALRLLARVPFAAVPVEADALPAGLISLGAFALLIVWWPDVNGKVCRRCLGACALVCVLAITRWLVWMPARIVVLDVGQGDAILVQDGPHAILVDTGPPGAVASALAREHVLRLDAIVITHLHDDHYGGVADIAGSIPCGQVLVGEGVGEVLQAANSDSNVGELEDAIEGLTGEVPEEISYGDTIEVGGFKLRMVWPERPTDGSENADSVELAVEYDSGGRQLRALLTGDAERDETGAVIAAGDIGDIDFLKVGHHGSEISLTAEEAEALDAEVAVASAGKDNDYGHPDPVCVGILEKSGSQFYCTIQHGDVTVEPGASGPVISCER